jgi:hypothetical protein
MKTFKYFYTLLLVVLLLPFTACESTDDGSYVAPITVYEKINGDWKITSLKQVDEIAKSNSQSPSEMTLTGQFDFSTFSISLDVDADKEPTTYKVGGSAPQFFPSEGYWALDYSFHNTDGSPNIINLFSDAAKTTAIGELYVTSIPGSNRTMELRFTRKSKGVAFVSYVYQLSPLNESNE